MTETRLLDYAFQHPTPTEIKASGAVGVIRYLTLSGAPKRVTADEIKQLHAAGLSVGFVYEDQADRAKTGGHAGGVRDAQEAYSQAHALGVPAGVVIFFACDQEATEAQVKTYYQGIASVKSPYQPGPYGDLAVVDGILKDRICKYGWQTVAWSGPGHPVSTIAHLYQRNSSKQPVAGTDENVLLHPFPLWDPPKTPAAAKAAPAPHVAAHDVHKPTPTAAQQEDNDMPVIVSNSQGGHYVTDFLTKRPIHNTDEEKQLIAAGLKRVTLDDAAIKAIADQK